VQRAARQLSGVRRYLVEPMLRRGGDAVCRGPRNRIVELRAHERSPRAVEHRTAIAACRSRICKPSERPEWFRDTLQPQLHLSVAPFEGRARPMHSLQGPRVAVRPAQLALDRPRRRSVGRLEELVETRHAKRARRLEVRQQVAQAGQCGMGRVMVGADEQRHVLPGGALHQRRAHLTPNVRQSGAGSRQRRADFVTLLRKMPQQDVPSVQATPAKKVLLLTRLSAQAAPHNPELHPELPRQRRQCGRMPECIGRVQHVRSPTQALGIRRAEQQVPDQRLPRRDQLVRQHVPRPYLQAAGFDECLQLALALGTSTQVILDEDGLTVEQEGPESRIGGHTFEENVEHRDEPRVKSRARKEPLAVPVRVRDQMKDECRHGRI